MRSIRVPRWGLGLLAMAVASLATAIAHAEADLEKTLVGRWEGEISTIHAKNATPVVLTIKSLKQEGGRWTAEASGGRTPVDLEIVTSGKQPSLRWTGANGTQYDVNLMDEKTLVGTATLSMRASTGDRNRPVKLEKK